MMSFFLVIDSLTLRASVIPSREGYFAITGRDNRTYDANPLPENYHVRVIVSSFENGFSLLFAGRSDTIDGMYPIVIESIRRRRSVEISNVPRRICPQEPMSPMSMNLRSEKAGD